MGFFKRLKKRIREKRKELKKISWVKSLGFRFCNTTDLAIMQDKLLGEYRKGARKISSQQMSDLENHVWVALAKRLAPNNLVIRQYCLIDLFKGRPEKISSISKLLKILSYDYKIWAEGYSYWLYTKDALDLWIVAFKDSHIEENMKKIDEGFIKTSYLKGHTWYPAPFGDLREVSLVDQISHTSAICTLGPVGFQKNGQSYVYTIKAKPIGLNTHIPKDDYALTIKENSPINFKFYQGYNLKYKNKAEELADTFSIKRIRSIPDAGF